MTRFYRLLLLFVLLLPALTGHAGEPRLVVNAAEYHFGSVYAGEQVGHVFRLRNEGDEVLRIDRVRSSCGCTAALLAASTIPPGGSTRLKANFDSSRFAGTVVKTVYLYSNDPGQPVTQLTLRGEVVPEIVLRPRELDLVDLQPGSIYDETVEIENRGRRDLVFNAVSSTAAEVSGELEQRELPAGETVTLQVRIEPQAGRKRLNAYLVLACEQQGCDVRLPVFARIAAPHGDKN